MYILTMFMWFLVLMMGVGAAASAIMWVFDRLIDYCEEDYSYLSEDDEYVVVQKGVKYMPYKPYDWEKEN